MFTLYKVSIYFYISHVFVIIALVCTYLWTALLQFCCIHHHLIVCISVLTLCLAIFYSSCAIVWLLAEASILIYFIIFVKSYLWVGFSIFIFCAHLTLHLQSLLLQSFQVSSCIFLLACRDFRRILFWLFKYTFLVFVSARVGMYNVLSNAFELNVDALVSYNSLFNCSNAPTHLNGRAMCEKCWVLLVQLPW